MNGIHQALRKDKYVNIPTEVAALLEEFGFIYKLRKFGGSYAVLLPRSWVDMSCWYTTDDRGEDTYWMKVDIGQDKKGNGVLTMTYPDIEEVTEFLVTNLGTGADSHTLSYAFSEEELIDICRKMLKSRGIEPKRILDDKNRTA